MEDKLDALLGKEVLLVKGQMHATGQLIMMADGVYAVGDEANGGGFILEEVDFVGVTRRNKDMIHLDGRR